MAKDYGYPSYDAGGRVKKYKEGGKTEKEKTDKELMRLATKPSGLARWKMDAGRPRRYDPKLPKLGDKKNGRNQESLRLKVHEKLHHIQRKRRNNGNI